MQAIPELENPSNLPVQTQLYLIERVSGAMVAAIGYTLLAVISVIYLQLNFLLILMASTGASFSLIYASMRQGEVNRISAFFTAVMFSLLVFITVALITESLVIGFVQHLCLMPLYGLYRGYQQGIKDVFKDIGNQLNAYYSFPSQFYPLTFKVYEIGKLCVSNRYHFIMENSSLRQKIIEVLAYLNALLEPIVAISRMEKLQLRLLEDCLSTHNLYVQVYTENDDVLQRAKQALDFCINIQLKIFEAYHGNRDNQRDPISSQLEEFILHQRTHISEFNRILSGQPFDRNDLNGWSNTVLGQNQMAADHLTQQAKDIWLNAYLATHPDYSVRPQDALQQAFQSRLVADSLYVLARQAQQTVRLQSSQQMTETYFNEVFALSPTELDAIRHTRLSDKDRAKCRESTQEEVQSLFKLYEAIEGNLQANCPISLDQPEPQNKVVLVKQYCSNNQTAEDRVTDEWLAVRHANGNVVFNLDSLKGLCCRASAQIRHPLDRDPLLPPHCGAYGTYHKTRYRYHPYYQNSNDPNDREIFSQTLQSIAVKLDKLKAVPDFRRSLAAQAASTRLAPHSALYRHQSVQQPGEGIGDHLNTL